MANLLIELKELEAAIAHANEVADSYKDTVPDCDCANEHRQLATWLSELKDIKEARLYYEVINPGEIQECPIRDVEEMPLACARCGSEAGMIEQSGGLVCGSCGALNLE